MEKVPHQYTMMFKSEYGSQCYHPLFFFFAPPPLLNTTTHPLPPVLTHRAPRHPDCSPTHIHANLCRFHFAPSKSSTFDDGGMRSQPRVPESCSAMVFPPPKELPLLACYHYSMCCYFPCATLSVTAVAATSCALQNAFPLFILLFFSKLSLIYVDYYSGRLTVQLFSRSTVHRPTVRLFAVRPSGSSIIRQDRLTV
jgi:hypothetical protein